MTGCRSTGVCQMMRVSGRVAIVLAAVCCASRLNMGQAGPDTGGPGGPGPGPGDGFGIGVTFDESPLLQADTLASDATINDPLNSFRLGANPMGFAYWRPSTGRASGNTRDAMECAIRTPTRHAFSP